MSDTEYTCPFCRTTSAGADTSCPACGAPVDVALRTTRSGWTELPPIADMAKIQLGHSSAQILGSIVPAAEMRLAAGEGVFFPAHHLLWREPEVQLANLPMSTSFQRLRAGLPIFMLQATGPGRASFSHDQPGEMVAVPLQPGSAVDVREHQMVAATLGLGYDWWNTGIWFTAKGDASEGSEAGGLGVLKAGLNMAGVNALDGDNERDEIRTVYPVGQTLDRFVAREQPGAVLVQAGGNAFVRDLDPGEELLIKPPALLFKDPGVDMTMHVEFPSAGMKLWRSWGNRYLWLRLRGPGRVGIQSSYDLLEDPGTDFRDSCGYSQQRW